MNRWNNWSVWGGLAFIGLGLLIFVGQLFSIDLIGRLWPLFIVAIGGLFFIAMVRNGPAGGPFAIPGSIITGIGLILLVQNLFGLWATWAYAWALIIASVGVGLMLFSSRSGIPELWMAGRIVVTIGLVLFFVFGMLFELGASLFGLSSLGGLAWPILLILLGLYVLFGRQLLGRWSGPMTRGSFNFAFDRSGNTVIEGTSVDKNKAADYGAQVSSPVVTEVSATGMVGVRRLKFSGLGDVRIIQGEREGLEIEASQAARERIITEVQGDTLIIRHKQDWWDWMTPTSWNLGRVIFTWYVRDLQSIRASGLGNIEGRQLTADRLEVSQSGTGNITLRDLNAQELLADQSGLGNIALDGRVSRQTVELSGTGSYQSGHLESQLARVRVSGLGTARVRVLEELDARISGTGSVEYSGNPRVSQSVSGLGSVRKVGE